MSNYISNFLDPIRYYIIFLVFWFKEALKKESHFLKLWNSYNLINKIQDDFSKRNFFNFLVNSYENFGPDFNYKIPKEEKAFVLLSFWEYLKQLNEGVLLNVITKFLDENNQLKEFDFSNHDKKLRDKFLESQPLQRLQNYLSLNKRRKNFLDFNEITNLIYDPAYKVTPDDKKFYEKVVWSILTLRNVVIYGRVQGGKTSKMYMLIACLIWINNKLKKKDSKVLRKFTYASPQGLGLGFLKETIEQFYSGLNKKDNELVSGNQKAFFYYKDTISGSSNDKFSDNIRYISGREAGCDYIQKNYTEDNFKKLTKHYGKFFFGLKGGKDFNFWFENIVEYEIYPHFLFDDECDYATHVKDNSEVTVIENYLKVVNEKADNNFASLINGCFYIGITGTPFVQLLTSTNESYKLKKIHPIGNRSDNYAPHENYVGIELFQDKYIKQIHEQDSDIATFREFVSYIIANPTITIKDLESLGKSTAIKDIKIYKMHRFFSESLIHYLFTVVLSELSKLSKLNGNNKFPEWSNMIINSAKNIVDHEDIEVITRKYLDDLENAFKATDLKRTEWPWQIFTAIPDPDNLFVGGSGAIKIQIIEQAFLSIKILQFNGDAVMPEEGNNIIIGSTKLSRAQRVPNLFVSFITIKKDTSPYLYIDQCIQLARFCGPRKKYVSYLHVFVNKGYKECLDEAFKVEQKTLNTIDDLNELGYMADSDKFNCFLDETKNPYTNKRSFEVASFNDRLIIDFGDYVLNNLNYCNLFCLFNDLGFQNAIIDHDGFLELNHNDFIKVLSEIKDSYTFIQRSRNDNAYYFDDVLEFAKNSNYHNGKFLLRFDNGKGQNKTRFDVSDSKGNKRFGSSSIKTNIILKDNNHKDKKYLFDNNHPGEDNYTIYVTEEKYCDDDNRDEKLAGINIPRCYLDKSSILGGILLAIKINRKKSIEIPSFNANDTELSTSTPVNEFFIGKKIEGVGLEGRDVVIKNINIADKKIILSEPTAKSGTNEIMVIQSDIELILNLSKNYEFFSDHLGAKHKISSLKYDDLLNNQNKYFIKKNNDPNFTKLIDAFNFIRVQLNSTFSEIDKHLEVYLKEEYSDEFEKISSSDPNYSEKIRELFDDKVSMMVEIKFNDFANAYFPIVRVYKRKIGNNTIQGI